MSDTSPLLALQAEFASSAAQAREEFSVRIRQARSGTVPVVASSSRAAVIQEGARSGRKVRLVYRNRHGQTILRRVSPYSYRGHLFFAKHGHTKSFITGNITSATLTQEAAVPDYAVEI